MNISMGWYIELYSDTMKHNVMCNVPGSVVSLIHTMDTSVTWIGDPPAIFFGVTSREENNITCICVIQSLYLYML